MKSFAGKVAVITGAGSGIGRYLALLLSREGANVAICDVNEETLEETRRMLERYNVAVSSHVCDVGDKEAIEALPAEVVTRHGKVDLVFNNAGVTVGAQFTDMSENDWDWAMGINLHGVINGSRAFLPHLLEQPEAALVNTSSIFGMVTVAGQTVYHATKFGVRGFTESLAKELQETNVQVHCVHPGHIGTNIVANSRMEIEESDDGLISRLLGQGGSQEERARAFRDNGMHPSRAAQIILDGVRRKRRRILVGWDARMLDWSQRLMPVHYAWLWPLFMIPIALLRNKRPLASLDELPATDDR